MKEKIIAHLARYQEPIPVSEIHARFSRQMKVKDLRDTLREMAREGLILETRNAKDRLEYALEAPLSGLASIYQSKVSTPINFTSRRIAERHVASTGRIIRPSTHARYSPLTLLS